MNLRFANSFDINLIAHLHAESWRSTYRDLLDPIFLSGPIMEDRLEVWTSRFATERSNRMVIIAEIDDEPVGFIYAVGGEDERWGTLVDNLHVLPFAKGKGIGSLLLKAAADWSAKTFPDIGMYLLCFERNEASCRFYQRHGGVIVERVLDKTPDGRQLLSLRYHWNSLDKLLKA